MWGAIAGIGAHLMVAGLVLAVLFVAQTAQSFVYLDNGALFYAAFGVAAALGMAVARDLGGRRAAALFATYCVIGMVIETAQAWLEQERVQTLGECCYVVRSTVEVALGQALTAAGLVLGLLAARRAPTWIRRARPVLEAAGAYALAALPVFLLFPFYDPRVAPFLVLQADDQWHIALVAIESAAAGLIVAFHRGADVSVRAAVAAVALTGLLTVAFADLSTWLHVPLHGWTYWPESLVFVPLASGSITLVIVGATRATRGVRRI